MTATAVGGCTRAMGLSALESLRRSFLLKACASVRWAEASVCLELVAVALLLLLPLGGPAAGQEADVQAVRACLAEAGDPLDCVGTSVEACVAGRPDGETTAGMVECIGTETAAWDRVLNEEYAATMAAFREMDATGDVVAEDFTREGKLREAQRAWIAFRDAECALQYSRWGMGTLRQVVGANCLMEATAERAVELRAMRAIE